MSFVLHPWQLYIGILAGWINRQQQEAIDYLRTENQVLKEKLGGKRVLLNDDQRRRLAVKGKILGRNRLYEIGTLFNARYDLALASIADRQEVGLLRSTREEAGTPSNHGRGQEACRSPRPGESFLGIRSNPGCACESGPRCIRPNHRQHPQKTRDRTGSGPEAPDILEDLHQSALGCLVRDRLHDGRSLDQGRPGHLLSAICHGVKTRRVHLAACTADAW